jgi:hypothetical protein
MFLKGRQSLLVFPNYLRFVVVCDILGSQKFCKYFERVAVQKKFENPSGIREPHKGWTFNKTINSGKHLTKTHLVGELTTENFQQVPDVPGGPVHVVVDLALADWCRFPVNDNLLDDEPHAGKALTARRIFPNRLFVNFVDS